MSDTPVSEPEPTESSPEPASSPAQSGVEGEAEESPSAEPEPSTFSTETGATSPLRKVEVDSSGMPRPARTPGAPSWRATAPPDEGLRRAGDNPPLAPLGGTGDAPAAPEQSAQAPLPRREPMPPLPDTQPLRYAAPEVTLRSKPLRPPPTSGQSRIGWGCVWRILLFSVLGSLALALIAVGAAIYAYWSIARTLPKVNDLSAHASQFETTRVYDAKNNLLYQIVDPQAGRRTHVPLNRISPYLIAATIATEDQNFYAHPGFDPVGIVRAILQNLRSGEAVSGASTITQQLVRALVLSPEERAQRTSMRKIREIILAAEITRTYTKDEILELYLNEIYYGNLAYGIEAASETYFNKPASDLNLTESSFLAGLPQAPSVYDVFTDKEVAFNRQRQVLGLMLELGCIPISTRVEPVCVTMDDVSRAFFDLENYPFTPPKSDARFPHWVTYVRQLLEDQYGAQTIYRSGFNVYTTLDPDLQTLGEANVAEQIAALADRHVTDGALVALRPSTGEILAMVGSDNFNDPVDGQINMALHPRQPGSSIKPLTYVQAFEKGWNPATLIWDVPTEFPDGSNPPYKPVNYDGRFHGPVLVRAALANSYNIPAVKALQFVGIYGDGGFIKFAESLGITSLNRTDYGLSLTLGGGEVPLLQMVGAYGALANGGQRVFPVSILKITDFNGQVICEQTLRRGENPANPLPCQLQPDNWGQQVITPENAYLIGQVLSDNDARTPAFGPSSPLLLSFPAAVKTGTTNDFRDNWTIGYTPDLVAGVWVGNADFTPMVHTTGVTGAAPIWHAFMEGALAGKATPFSRPQGIVEKTICSISGAEPSEFCPPTFIRTELFSATNGPLPKDRDLWEKAFIDPFTGLRQSADCAKYYQEDTLFTQEKTVIAVSDPWAQKWLVEDPNGQAWATTHGITLPIAWAPTADCTADSPHPIMSFAFPPEGATLTGMIQISGQANATKDFDHYILEYGLSHDPIGWGQLLGPTTNPVPETGHLADWDLNAVPDGEVALRIVVFNKSGGSAEVRVHFTVQHPTPVPPPPDTPVPPPPPTLTKLPTATATLAPIETNTPVPPTSTTAVTDTLPPPTPSDTPSPSDTPLPTATETP